MFDTKRTLLCLGLTLIAILFAHDRVIAEEIGTTPEGNVVYMFRCPLGGFIKNVVGPKIDWYNHLGDHPEWDIVDSTDGQIPRVMTEFSRKTRAGQVLTCEYRVKFEGSGIPQGLLSYRYKVKRDIISCEIYHKEWKCILRDGGGGGESSSSATSASPTPSSSSGTTSASPGVARGCCTMLPNPMLKGRLGRAVVTFSDGAMPKNTRVDVLKDGKVVKNGYGNQSWDLLSGAYEVTISGKRVPNVTVKAGHDTIVKVGVLRVSAAKDTRVDVLDAGTKLTSDYGEQIIGFPPGSYDIQVAGQTERVTISEGQVTDF